MASNDDGSVPNPQPRVEALALMKDAQVHITKDNKLQIDFQIDDLLKKLIPDAGAGTANCGGCNGCTGCSM